VPVSAARAMRADFVIAVDLNNDLLTARDLGGIVAQLPPFDPDAPPPGSLRRNGKPWPKWLAPNPAITHDDVRIPPAPSARTPSLLSAMAQSIDIMQVRITRSRLAGEPADILIQPRLGGMGIFDFHRAQPAIAEGRAAVERMMPAVRAHLLLD
jgi:NTE family protein